jgi:hypothetical protein
MDGMRGDDDEHPANNRAERHVSITPPWVKGKRYLQSNMMAIAINIISTWWYPRNGISPIENQQPLPQNRYILDILIHPT